jgi:translation initiation factor IF-2
MKFNTMMMRLWLFLISATLALGQNTAPCPAGSSPVSGQLAGQSSTSGRPAAPAATNTMPGATTSFPATAAPTPAPAAPVPAPAAAAPGPAMPRSVAPTTQARNSAPRPRSVNPQRSMPSGQTLNHAPGNSTTTASLNATPSPCTPSNNGGQVPAVTGPPN